MTTITTLTTYTAIFAVGDHKLPIKVAAANRGEATNLARKILRERIGDPTYGNFPISVVEQPVKVGARAIATNPTVVKRKVRIRTQS